MGADQLPRRRLQNGIPEGEEGLVLEHRLGTNGLAGGIL